MRERELTYLWQQRWESVKEVWEIWMEGAVWIFQWRLQIPLCHQPSLSASSAATFLLHSLEILLHLLRYVWCLDFGPSDYRIGKFLSPPITVGHVNKIVVGDYTVSFVSFGEKFPSCYNIFQMLDSLKILVAGFFEFFPWIFIYFFGNITILLEKIQ